MTTINSSASDYAGLVHKAVKRNTAIEVIDAKQSGTPINKDEIRASNQEIKDKSLDLGLNVYQANIKKNSLDTYVHSSEQAKEFYSTDSDDTNNTEISSFDPQAANEARSTAQRRAVGIDIYENIQSRKRVTTLVSSNCCH